MACKGTARRRIITLTRSLIRCKMREIGKGNTGKPLEKLFRSVADVRHTAVHRIRVSARGVEQFLLDAEGLATLLEDKVCLKSLTKLRRDTQLGIEELERNKHVLSSNLGETLKRTAAKRAELDRIEEEAIDEMVKEDGEYQVFAGSNLEQAIMPLDATAVTMENEISSDVDDIDSVEDYGSAPNNSIQLNLRARLN
ncbi:hypothetical protein EDB80DRAFT_877373 [Ilyonectria destructans]|nr:hypothetical protein EDB80DRAFT_877373 [Ilyonectria destructans]